MAVSTGAIHFTGNFTGPNGDGTSNPHELISFIAVHPIPAGEVIVLHAPEAGSDSTITFTVGPAGLAPLDRVTIAEGVGGAQGATALLEDPSGGSVTPAAGDLWSITGADNIIASSNGQAIAAISNRGAWDVNFAETGLSRTNIDIAIANDDPSPVIDNITADSGDDENALFAGTDIADIDDPAFWVHTDVNQDYAAPNISGTTFATQDAGITCFLAGTGMATPDGARAVEDLAPGDLLRTLDGRDVPVRWVGRTTVSTGFGPAERLMPVRIRAGALGDGLPLRDLLLTADHALYLDGMLVNAGALVDGAGIAQVPLSRMGERYTVYHVETEAHEVLLAEGAPAESYVDYAGRRSFDNFADYMARYGTERVIPEMACARISSRRQVPERLRKRLVA
ncbi:MULTISPECIES: Hint domain-containing protein [Mameliella]|uniref:Hint domain-containing protein n=1 Tax=Mameliella TaxID=1434019 RepID=UPI000B5352B3|nr:MULTISPECIES: Hint domain-containing protein [Mameliella]MCR9271769.1 Hint domain-containing protein [Paracoccaceae bacterium]OWV60803.1 hypothetical protein CDZ98_07030 [Mameliella alba]